MILLLALSSCQTYISANGNKHRQLFPTKDKGSINDLDTSRFVRKPFQDVGFNTVDTRSSRKTVVPVSGTDLKALIEKDSEQLIYFANPGCPATAADIRKLDSLAKTGQNIIIVSLRKSYDRIDVLLRNTAFSKAPYYVVEDDKYGDVLLVKQIRVIKDLCESCYTQYRDDLAVAEYIIVGNGRTEVILYNDERNVMNK